MNECLIPCEICSELFTADEYIIHITTHAPNENLSSNHNNQDLNIYGSYDTPLIPCDSCSQQVPLNQYESHLLLHSLSSASSNNHNTNSNLIPCLHPNCNQQIPFNEYETHRLRHLDETHETHETHESQMIECKYSECSTKWIPYNEYNDHLTLHQLQSEQTVANTSNDALIAFNHQTQIIQQQTISDPRRICVSNSFMHLQGSQKPVIPIHDALRLSIDDTLTANANRNNIRPSRDNHHVSNIIESLHQVLGRKSHIEYYLCDELQFYYRDREDYSWGCGFRNCQTQCSSLILSQYKNNDLYRRILWNGIAFVPTIYQIQKYLDYAHAQGFDPQGAKELGLTQGRRVWIGAVDVAALLRSFYIPASIYDFQLNTSNSNNNSDNNNNTEYHDDLFKWVWDYFVQRYKYYKVKEIDENTHASISMKKAIEKSIKEMNQDSDSGSSFSDTDHETRKEEKKSHGDHYNKHYSKNKKNYDSCDSINYSKRFIAPLYFQHQGHSRTIIGIMHNKRSGIRHLLVLDPSVKGGGIGLLNKIKNGNIQSLLRSKKQIRAVKYQIVAIPAFGIMSNNDRNRCKTIQSMDVSSINLT